MYQPRPVPEAYQDVRTFLEDELADIAYWLRQSGADLDHGHIYGRGGKTTPSTPGTYQALGNTSAVTWASGLLEGMTRTSDALYSTNGGTFFFSLTFGVEWLTSGVNYRGGLSVNGAQPTAEQRIEFANTGGAAMNDQATLTGLVTLTAGQYAQPMVTSLVSSAGVDHTQVELTMVRVSE